ncbi:MAG: glycerol kinase GlpK [Planctomycetota bacterium]
MILAIDQGTTGSTALVLDDRGQIRGRATREFPQHYPKPGWVEHDLEQIWKSVRSAVRQALRRAEIVPRQLKGVGITNQRETVAFLDRRTGEPLAPAIVWQCRRSADICERMKAEKLEKRYRQKTGLVLDPYFSGTKIRWALDHWAPVRRAAKSGNLLVGTIDSFLVHRLTGGRSWVTDVTNASRTLLFDLDKLDWRADLAEPLGVSLDWLPEVKRSVADFGVVDGQGLLPDGLPITGIAGDQQAALFGNLGLKPGAAKCTYGTGAFLLLHTGQDIVRSRRGLLTSPACQIDDKPVYVLEGSAFIAGAAVQWLRDGLKLIKKASDIEGLASTVPDTGGVMFVPALAGLGAPHWRSDARGAFFGMTRGTTRAHLARAVLEGIALQIADLAEAASEDAGRKIRVLKVDGGAAANDLLMQFQANILGVRLSRPHQLETTALGAAFLAGLGVGLWKSPKELEKVWQEDRSFRPEMREKARAEWRARWQHAVERC